MSLRPLLLAAPLLAAAAASPLHAEMVASGPVIGAGNTLLSVSAEGHSTRTPDLAVFSAGVTSQARTASAALTANSADMNRVIAALMAAGIADKDIQTSQISLNPVYAQNPNGEGNPHISGYQANNTVSIKQRDIRQFGKVLDTLVAAGANQINGPSFQLDNADAAMDEARVAAIKAARARADLYARAAGLHVVRILSIAEGGGYNPTPQPVFAMARMKAEAAPTPVAEGEVETQVSVSVQFELAP